LITDIWVKVEFLVAPSFQPYVHGIVISLLTSADKQHIYKQIYTECRSKVYLAREFPLICTQTSPCEQYTV